MREITKLEYDRIVQSDNFFPVFPLFLLFTSNRFLCALLCAMACGKKVIDFLCFLFVHFCVYENNQKIADHKYKFHWNKFFMTALFAVRKSFCILGETELFLLDSREKLMKRFWVGEKFCDCCEFVTNEKREKDF